MIRRIFFLCVFSLIFSVVASASAPPAPRNVNLTAPDGTKLKATFFSAGEKPGPGVLLLHQCNQQRKNWDDLAAHLAAAGINVLTLDFRGFGESGGTAFSKLSGPEAGKLINEKFPGDVDVAFQYLVKRPGVTKDVIGAGGASCGVNQSIQLARRHPEVKSLVLLSGNTDKDGRAFLRKSDGLPLFISAADDDGAAVELMEWLYSISPNTGNKFAHYTAGGHGTEMLAAHKELADMIVDWFVTTLIKTPGSAPATRASASPSRAPSILEIIDSPGGAGKVAEILASSRQNGSNSVPFSEGITNVLGYEHLTASDTKGAIEIMKLNVMGYPDSPNVYDSLADAYLADGQKGLAKVNAQKALELLATDKTDPEARRQGIKESAEQKLKQLSEKQP
ncbi:MAG TPA: alpha/beta fold hydrolase [Candidatus Udaeobacter sp.]|nr:alpha/beta fold hydrolase [Candidatus Udaeobacter sp.]